MNTQGLISTRNSMVRSSTMIGILLGSLVLAIPAFSSAQSLVASVLPTSRSVQVGGTPATAFATIINADMNASATQCFIDLATAIPSDFLYQTTDSTTNALIGTPNTPVDIAADSSQSFVIVFTPTSAFDPLDVELTFDCDNSDPVAVIPGVNTLLLSASTDPVPDIIAIAATPDMDGNVKVPDVDAMAAFAVATSNVGAGDTISVTVEPGSASVPFGLSLCETDPDSSVCINPPLPAFPVVGTVTTTIAAGAQPTFGVFVTATGAIPPDAATNRIFVRFEDTAGITRGATSVAVQTLPNVVGVYTGTTTETDTGCIDPADNGTFTFDDTIDVSEQMGDQFSGMDVEEEVIQGVRFREESAFSGTVAPDGAFDGTSTSSLFINGILDSSSEGTFNGTLSGNMLTVEFSGRDVLGDTCSSSGTFTGTR